MQIVWGFICPHFDTNVSVVSVCLALKIDSGVNRIYIKKMDLFLCFTLYLFEFPQTVELSFCENNFLLL